MGDLREEIGTEACLVGNIVKRLTQMRMKHERQTKKVRQRLQKMRKNTAKMGGMSKNTFDGIKKF